MKGTDMPDGVSHQNLEYAEQFQAQFGQYMEKQPPIIRGLNRVLQVLAMPCIALAGVMFVIALYHTFLWAFAGQATLLANAWVNYGLSMSLMVFPWGLDSMLMRVFPAFIFPAAWHRSSKAIQFRTGVGAFFAGFGIMCAGAPGAACYIGLASQALHRLF